MRWIAICSALAERLGVHVHSIVRGNYAEALRLVAAGDVEAIIVARNEHIPHGPRVIVASEFEDDPGAVQTVPIRRRRPRQRKR